jgi:SAM-dependent methyltransferase
MAAIEVSRAQAVEVDYADFFESIYADAHGDRSRIPWSDGEANPALVAWLNVVAPSLVRCGCRVAVVGCGLGEDARELIARGYDVTAFDVSPTAVEWARSLDPAHEECYQHADLFNPPARWRHRFDLVIEIYTVQSLPPSRRAAVLGAMRELISPHGVALVICRGAAAPTPLEAGPPWPLTERELLDAAAKARLAPAGPIDAFMDDEDPPKLRLRAAFKRGA